MYEAARVTDGINHTSALAGFLAGALVGIALIAAVAFCTFTCGFGAALLAGLLAGFGAQAALMLGEAWGSSHSSPAGTIKRGSSNVNINGKPAAIVQESTAACDKHPPLPLIAEGSSNVFINGVAAARKDDHITCGAKIGSGSQDVFIGGGRVAYLHYDDEVPDWLRTATKWAFVLAGLAGGLAALVREAGEVTLKALTPCVVKYLVGYAAGTVISEAASKYVIAPVIGAIVGHPVQLTTGRKILLNQDETDFVLNGRMPISGSRYYGSNLNIDGMLGLGWMHEWDVSLRLDDDKLIHTDMQGRETPYPVVSKGKKIYSEAEQRTLARTDDGRYFLYGLDEIYYEFAQSKDDACGIYRLCGIENQLGLRTTLERDGTGRLQQMHGASGERLQFHYQHPKGRLTSIELLEGGTPGLLVQYRYDAHDQLSAVFNRANEQTRSFAYAHGLMVEHINAIGLICKYKWAIIDGTPRVVEHSNSEGETYKFGYDTQKRESWATDTFDRIARWHYDENFQVLESIGFDGELYVFQYDDNGNLTEMHLPEDRHVQFEYDSLSRLIAETDPLGRVTKYEYHKGSSRETCRTLPDGTVWRASYDPRGLLLEQKDPIGRLTKYEYSDDGIPIAIIDAKGGRKTMEWNDKGQTTAYVDCSGKATRYEYNGDGYLTAIVDAIGQRTSASRDVIGNLLAVKRPDGSTEQFQYDTLGNVLQHTNPLGQTRCWERNGRGQTTKVTGFTNRSQEYRYDKHGRVIELVNGNGASYRFEYNAADYLQRKLSIDGIEKRYEYNGAGMLTGMTVIGRNPDGKTEQHGYLFERDAAGRLITRHTDSATTQYEFDPRNRLLAASRKPTAIGVAQGILPDELYFEYDNMGNLVKETGANGTFAYQYDELGNLESTTLPQGQVLNVLQYGSGHAHQIMLDDQIVCDIERDDLHREIVRSQGRLTARFGYDTMGRKAWQNAAMGGIEETTTIGAGQGQLWRNYRYGLQSELTGFDDNLRGQTRYQYDPEGRLLSTRNDDHAFEHFAWDDADNLQAPYDGKTSVGRVENNRLMAWQDIRFTYDAFGNVQTKKKGSWQEQHFKYDADDRLIEVSGSNDTGSSVTRFAYDALGRRIGKEVVRPPQNGQHEPSKEETRFAWQGMRMVQEVNGNVISSYIYDPTSGYNALARYDQRLDADGKVAKGKLYYLHADQIGTPLEVTNADGKLVWAGDYRAWGKVERQVPKAFSNMAGGQFTQNLRFAGQYADESTGLHYNTYRFYDPDVGRYTTQDLIGLMGGVNLYQYGTNPTKWVDPLGLMPWLNGASANITVGDVSKVFTSSSQGHAEINGLNWFMNDGPGFKGQNVTISDVMGNMRPGGDTPIGVCAQCRENIFPLLQRGGAASVTLPKTVGNVVQGTITIPASEFEAMHAEIGRINKGPGGVVARSNAAWEALEKKNTGGKGC